MQESATITMVYPDGHVRTIACSHDGNPNYVGATLLNHYATEKRLNDLMFHGHLYWLGRFITYSRGEHSPENPQDGVSLFWGRDLQEPDSTMWVFPTHEDMMEACWEDFDYHYFFRDDTWWLYGGNENKPLVDVCDRWKYKKDIFNKQRNK